MWCGVVCCVVVCLYDELHALHRRSWSLNSGPWESQIFHSWNRIVGENNQNFALVSLCLNLLLHSVLIVGSSYMLATDNEGNLITITYVVSYLKYIQTLATYLPSLASLTNLCPLNFMPCWLYAVGSGNIPITEITVQKEGDHRLMQWEETIR